MNLKRRPDETGAAQESAGRLITSKDTTEPEISHAADHFRDCYAVLVRGKTIRRHLYFSLPAAERAVKRAEARGASADMVLVLLVPVDDRKLDKTVRRPAGTDDMLRALDDVGIADTTEAVVGDD